MACRGAFSDGRVLQEWTGGWQTGNTLWVSYLHVHFAQRPEMLLGVTAGGGEARIMTIQPVYARCWI